MHPLPVTGLTGKIAMFHGPGEPFSLKSFPVRDLEPGEVLIRNRYTTICGSDLHTWCGSRQEPCPTVLGHEIVGEIVQLHPVHPGMDHDGVPLQPGDLVTWSIFASDPASPQARQGMPQKGEGLFKYGHARVEAPEVFHGGLAEYCVLKAHTAILKIPAGMPLPVAATLNCAIATVAGALRIAGPVRDKKILITGMGLLGLTCAAMCREAGAMHITAADVAPARLLDAGAFGAHATQLTGSGAPLPEADVAFDFSGAPDAMEAALDQLTLGGTAVWIGAVFKTRGLMIDPEKVIRRILTIKGLHNYNYEDFSYALRFMRDHHDRYPFHQVVAKEFPLNEAQAAFEFAATQKPYRVGIRL